MLSAPFAFIGRVMLALIFIVSGAMKLSDIGATEINLASVGMPTTLALPAILFELVGGIMIAFGIFTRITALLFAGFCLLTALMFHSETADPVQASAALKNIAIAGGFLCLFAYDQKSWSFDSYRNRRRREAEVRVAQTSDHPGTGAG